MPEPDGLISNDELDPTSIFDSSASTGSESPESEPAAPTEPSASSPPVEPGQSDGSTSFIDAWNKEYGENLDYANDKAFMDDIANIILSAQTPEEQARSKRLSDMEPVIGEYVENQQKFQEWKEQQKSAPAEPAPESQSQQKSTWEYEPLDEITASLIQNKKISINPETGRYTGDDVISKFVANANRHRDVKTSRAEEIVENPFEAVRKSGMDVWADNFKKDLMDEAQKFVEGKFADVASAGQVQRAWSQAPDGLSVLDENGNIRTDSTGYPQRTAKGQVYDNAYADLAEAMGITKEDEISSDQQLKLLQFAEKQARRYEGQTGDDSVQPAQNTQQGVPERKQESQQMFMDAAKGNGQANRLTNQGESISAAASAYEELASQSEHMEDIYDRIAGQG